MVFLSNTDVLILAFIALGTWYLHGYIQERQANPKNLPLPPGPKGYPIIGSLFAFPRYKAWLEYDKWSKIYGDMIYFKVFGHGFLILGSLERAYDIFERRSSNFSDRPHLVMLYELMDMAYVFTFQGYGTWWRRHRRHFHDHFHPNVIHKYHPILINSSRTFINRLLASPEKFISHSQYAFADGILKVIYGMNVQEHESYIDHGKDTLAGLAAAGHPGAFLVDIFPIMKIIPEWFPGAGWKKKAKAWRHVNSIVANCLWDLTKNRMEAGTAEPCIATAMMEDIPEPDNSESSDEEIVRRNTCAAGFIGKPSSYRSVSCLLTTMYRWLRYYSFYGDIILHGYGSLPGSPKKAQAELDRVLGDRLPEYNDRPNLPYINALIKESIRWQPVTPLAVTHTSSNADEYNGYYIPKGTNVIGNSWSILHDPVAYKDPFVYNPDRFLKNGKIDRSVRDPTVASFGFGRRGCPGRFYSDAALFATVTHVLIVFDIEPGLDRDGNEIEIIPSMTDGLVSFPEAFECRVVPRSKEAEQLIRNSSLMA